MRLFVDASTVVVVIWRCSDAGQPAVPRHAVARDEPAVQRLLHHDAAATKSSRPAALSVSVRDARV